jgi:hypothetical protein
MLSGLYPTIKHLHEASLRSYVVLAAMEGPNDAGPGVVPEYGNAISVSFALYNCLAISLKILCR